jgi:hypothetical protein
MWPTQPPSKGLFAIASIWVSAAIVERLSYSGAETLFDVPRWRRRLGTVAFACLCRGRAGSRRRRRKPLNPHLGDGRIKRRCRGVLLGRVYSDQLQPLGFDTGLHLGVDTRTGCFSICFLILRYCSSILVGAGSIFG